jgi:hypothetical protein
LIFLSFERIDFSETVGATLGRPANFVKLALIFELPVGN